jgi:hypothetical protein
MASPALCRAPPKYSRHRQMKKKQGRPGPASARPRPRRRRPPVLRSPRQRCHHHHTPGALLGPPPPHLGSSVGSLGRHASREGVAAPRPDLRPPPPRSERAGREPPGHGQSRSREEAATAAPGEEGRTWGGGQPARGRIRCRTAPRPLLPRPGEEGVEPPRFGGGGRTPHHVMGGDAPQWIRRPRGCRHRRNRKGRPGVEEEEGPAGAEEEGRAGRGRRVQGEGRGRGHPAGRPGAPPRLLGEGGWAG